MREDLAWQVAQNLRPSLITDTRIEIEPFATLVGAQETRLADLAPGERESIQDASGVLRRLRSGIPTAIEKPFIPVGSLRIRPGNNEDEQ
ncbi:hypothetical protein V3C33_03845 [Micrococcaceae bacterium Sec5.7]